MSDQAPAQARAPLPPALHRRCHWSGLCCRHSSTVPVCCTLLCGCTLLARRLGGKPVCLVCCSTCWSFVRGLGSGFFRMWLYVVCFCAVTAVSVVEVVPCFGRRSWGFGVSFGRRPCESCGRPAHPLIRVGACTSVQASIGTLGSGQWQLVCHSGYVCAAVLTGPLVQIQQQPASAVVILAERAHYIWCPSAATACRHNR